MATKVIMPQLGESVVEGTITKWLFKEGDPIQELDALLEVNTDKVDTEIPAPAAGVVLKLLYPEGTTLNAGTIIAWIGQPGEAIPGGEAGDLHGESRSLSPSKGTAAEGSAASTAAAAAPGLDRDLGFISPVVARLAREHKLDLFQLTGTGEGRRITKRDVLAFV
ncbi:MAG TPA: biotin/lipoyl-containing protein, partial [Anaerolineaceae bacterium]|nr:biotin/lipoyl-containing protein [Anaerolineaceae bacterium]